MVDKACAHKCLQQIGKMLEKHEGEMITKGVGQQEKTKAL
jgi:hypothetical protein